MNIAIGTLAIAASDAVAIVGVVALVAGIACIACNADRIGQAIAEVIDAIRGK